MGQSRPSLEDSRRERPCPGMYNIRGAFNLFKKCKTSSICYTTRMTVIKISSGTIHQLPADLRKALAASPKALATWESITPLARNEWICWVVTNKKPETRKNHIKRAIEELAHGERRPCCWMGCIHRTDKPISPSQKFVLSKRSKKS